MPNYDRATPEMLSQLVFEYRRLSGLLRRVYLDDTDEPIDIDEFGKRLAKRGTFVGTLGSMGQRNLIGRLSEEDHLFWRLAVLQAELAEKGATPRDIANDSSVLYLNEQIKVVHGVIKSIIGNPQSRKPREVSDDHNVSVGESGAGAA
jgi:hypothetical protein